MITHQVTHDTRYRAQNRLFRKPLLVLQVRVEVTGYQHDGHGGTDDVNYSYWRDATVEDINFPIAHVIKKAEGG